MNRVQNIPFELWKYKAVRSFHLKYGNTKLLGNTKYDRVKLVLAVFAFVFSYQVSIKLY